MLEIGKRENAVKIKKVGGKAFPGDYDWKCNICGSENRAFQLFCQNCEHMSDYEIDCIVAAHEEQNPETH